jgi:hypothetical protein
LTKKKKGVVSNQSHPKNIFDSEELYEKSAVSILETTAKDKKVYKVKHFNLDAVLSVGYRVNSKKATHFRQWATKTLKEHIQKGYTINRHKQLQRISSSKLKHIIF